MGVLELVEFPSIRAEKLVLVGKTGRGLSALLAINCEPRPHHVTILPVGTLQRTGTWRPSTFYWEEWSRCTGSGNCSPCKGPTKCRNVGPSTFPQGGSVWAHTIGVYRVWHTKM